MATVAVFPLVSGAGQYEEPISWAAGAEHGLVARGFYAQKKATALTAPTLTTGIEYNDDGTPDTFLVVKTEGTKIAFRVAGNEYLSISSAGLLSALSLSLTGTLVGTGTADYALDGTAIGDGSNYTGLWLRPNSARVAQNYTLLGSSTGDTMVNARTGRTIYFRFENLDKARVASDGTFWSDGAFVSKDALYGPKYVGLDASGTGMSVVLEGREADSATAVGTVLNTLGGYATAGAKLTSFRNSGAEKSYITKDGYFAATAETVIEQNGDEFGTTRLRIRNRSGSNGAVFENAALELVDFQFKTPTVTRGLRFENRIGSAWAGTPSLHFGGASPDTPTLAVGDDMMVVNSGRPIKGSTSDGASAVSLIFDTVNDLTVAGARLASFRNLGLEKTSIRHNGDIVTTGSITSDDLHTSRVDGSGALYLGADGQAYFYRAGSTFLLGGGILAMQTPLISANPADTNIQFWGNLAADNAAADVVVTSSATRTAGRLFSIQNAAVEKAYFRYDGGLITSAGVGSNIGFFYANGGNTGATLKGNKSDEINAVAVTLDNYVTLGASGTKLLSVKNNTVEKFYVDKDGVALAVAGLNTYGDLWGGAQAGSSAFTIGSNKNEVTDEAAIKLATGPVFTTGRVVDFCANSTVRSFVTGMGGYGIVGTENGARLAVGIYRDASNNLTFKDGTNTKTLAQLAASASGPYIQSAGYSTTWGTTNGTSTGALNAVMGTGANATWLLSGTSGGTFRYGIQGLDSGSNLRFYSGANYFDFSSNVLNTPALTVAGDTYLAGKSKIVVQNNQDGGTTAGIYLWNTADPGWVIYMAQSGSGKSAAGGAACTSLTGATTHHMRFRCYGANNYGFIWENTGEACLMSLNASDGGLRTAGGIHAGNDIRTVRSGGSTGVIYYGTGEHYTYYDGANYQMPNGALYVGGDVVANWSDRRLKKNLTVIESPLAKVQALSGYMFDWDEEACAERGVTLQRVHDIGLIAQEVEAVIPEAVVKKPADPMKPEGDDLKSVRYDKLTALLIEAMKEQQGQIEALKAEVAALQRAVA